MLVILIGMSYFQTKIYQISVSFGVVSQTPSESFFWGLRTFRLQNETRLSPTASEELCWQMAACVSRGSATQWTCRLRVTHLAALCFCVFLCKRCVGQGEGVAAESKGDNPFTVFKFVVDVRCSNYSREQIHVENPLCASIYKKKMLLVVSGKSLECMAFRQEPPYVCV